MKDELNSLDCLLILFMIDDYLQRNTCLNFLLKNLQSKINEQMKNIMNRSDFENEMHWYCNL